MINCVIDGKSMTTRELAHDEIAINMKFPAYYGRNLDALWDMASTIQADVTMINVASMLAALGSYGGELLSTLYEAAEYNGDFHFTVKN